MRAGLAIGLALVLFVAVNLFAHPAFKRLRLDLTERQLYTLGAETEAVLAAIDEPIVLRLAYSQLLGEAVPGIATYAARVRDLLEEYEAASGGRIVVEIVDPEPFTPEEDRALAEGLAGVPVGAGEALAYFGLVGRNSIDAREVIPFLDPAREAELEYELTRLVHGLATLTKPVVGLLGRLPLAGSLGRQGPAGAEPPFLIHRRLAELFELRALDPETTTIDPDIDVLLLVHPRDLSPATLYAIDQFVLRGGRALAFVDPVSEAEAIRRPPERMFAPNASDLGPLAASWGLDLVPGLVVGDEAAAMPVDVGAPGRPQALDYLAWLELDLSHLSPLDRVTRDLEMVAMGTAGMLRPRPGATTRLEPLILSSRASTGIEVAKLRLDPDPMRLLVEFQPGGERLWLAARIQGDAPSGFPDGPPPGAPEGPHLARSEAPLDVIVVADTDLLDDRFWVEVRDLEGGPVALPFADNDDFVVNAVETLSGTLDLSGLRGRTTLDRPFERVQALEREAAARFRETERALLDRLDQAERELAAQEAAGEAVVSAERRATLEALRARMVEVRRELREVRRALREDVERLERRLLFANIWLMPILVLALALGLAVLRARRRRAVPA